EPVSVRPVDAIIVGHLAFATRGEGNLSGARGLISPGGIVLNTPRRIDDHDHRPSRLQQPYHVGLGRGVPTQMAMRAKMPKIATLRHWGYGLLRNGIFISQSGSQPNLQCR